ncbi:hypothetical protein HG535_0B02790 [Zygotorulaspora mrakii]|uniref:Pre-mRNA-splicing factor SLU7 n=1 Tax=Zygotorulaspora mrakii TaxID=42260 RepID=A0A7H9AXV0_ZYGMR|nr:uncharacterized protein HG535_0B02790 [Zygotorulaspora mrakii]QLG71240.1 hypothetical protein HG535_0B02790 [Zygotorulaspora mrakii]
MSGNSKSSDKSTSRKENIHIPRYIKNQPWFYKDGESQNNTEEDNDYLIHHRQSKKDDTLDIDNNSEPKVGSGITDEFETVRVLQRRNGKQAQCTNCGASDHKRIDCLERPRKVSKREDFESVISVRKDPTERANWDARKDRWYGYSGEEYDKLIKSWEKKNQGSKNPKSDTVVQDALWDTDEEIELTKLGLYKDSTGMLKQDDATNSKLQRASVRLREDRAAYLNDVKSSEINYDPKSRLYKSEALGATDEKSRMFRRHLTGEALELNELNKFSREHAKKLGIKDEVENESRVNHVLVANPTKYEHMMREQKSQQAKPTDSAKLEAKRSKGTAQTEKTKKKLRDLYG